MEYAECSFCDGKVIEQQVKTEFGWGSEVNGTHTLSVEITNISKHGFWLLLADDELFLPFSEFPWFKEAPVSAILNVELPQPYHLYWPDFDVDLTVEPIEHPERFPLVASPGD